MSFKESNRDESTVQRGFVDFFQTRPDSNKLPLLRVIELNPQANSSLHASRRNANDFKKDQTKSQAEGPGFLGLSPKARGLILLNLVRRGDEFRYSFLSMFHPVWNACRSC